MDSHNPHARLAGLPSITEPRKRLEVLLLGDVHKCGGTVFAVLAVQDLRALGAADED
jgi:hypothetical protein